ncbi:MAG TPA: DUF4157 domain-containing protein [Puia sp.]|jgi:hypothetical protein|nr:DUF4157 domain-containing protein [Puia sp.]
MIKAPTKTNPAIPSDGQKAAKPFFGRAAPADNHFYIQTKLEVGSPDDRQEREADDVAAKVMKVEAAPGHESFFRPAASFGQASSFRPEAPLQRKCRDCEIEDKMGKGMIARKADSMAAGAFNSEPASVSSAAPAANVLQSPGQPLQKETRDFMESRFGQDFSQVRVHNDAQAHQSSAGINAKAYAHREHIVFGEGSYQPHNDQGKELIAHELAHVVQQTDSGREPVIRRRPGKDEEMKYKDAGLHYGNAFLHNLDAWHNLNMLYDIHFSDDIYPSRRPHAYANHVYEMQQVFIRNNPKDWASHPADGILDSFTLGYLLGWAKFYGENKDNPDVFVGLDTGLLDRLSRIQKTGNPPLRASYLKNIYQFQLVNDLGLVIETGARGDFVAALQKALIFLHYDITEEEQIGKEFGPETKAAVEKFQRDTGLSGKSVDGRFGQHTLRALDTLLAGKGSILVLPGIHSFIEGFLLNGLEMYIDGDGDQRKELKLKFTGRSNRINLAVTNIDTGETKGPFAFTLPGLDTGKEIQISQWQATDGIRPSIIKLENPGKPPAPREKTPPGQTSVAQVPALPDNRIEIDPPKKIKTTGEITLRSGTTSYTASFDTSKMQFSTVVSSELALENPNISANLRLGYFNDPFKFTLVRDGSKEDKAADDNGKGGVYHYLLKVAAIGRSGAMAFGDDIPFTLSESRLERLIFHVIEKDETSLIYDFDGDGTGDIKVNTILQQVYYPTQEDKKLPETGRRVTVVFTGPALEKRLERPFDIVNGEIQFRERKTEDVFQGAIAAEGGRLLKEQKVPEKIDQEIGGLDAALDQYYRQAAMDQVIRRETYVAFLLVKAGFKALAPIMQKKEYELTEEDINRIHSLILYAGSFYQLFKDETKDARKELSPSGTEVSSTDTETNPFTQESVTTTITPGVDASVSKYELHLSDEIARHEWEKALATFNMLRTGYNLWVSEQVKNKKPEKAAESEQILNYFQYQTGLEKIANDPSNKYITRVRAIYYSWEQFTQEPGIKHIELPMYYYLDEADNKWWLVDFVRPDHPFKRKVAVDDTNKHIVRNDHKTPAPPKELFEKLDDKEHLPKGVVLYDAGEGLNGRIEMTEPWQWKDILGWIGLGLAAIGLATLVVFSGGTAAPVAAEVFFALAAIAGGTAAALDIYSMYKDEEWGVKRAALDIGQIVASILSLGTLSAGRLVVVAQEAAPEARLTGTWAKLAALSEARYVPLLAKLTIGADLVNLALIGEDTLEKLAQIDQMTGLDDASRTRAKIFLLSQLLFATGMTVFSLRGNIGGLDKMPTLVVHAGPDGVPMVSDARVWLPENLHSADLLGKIRATALEEKFPPTAAEEKMYNVDNLINGLQNEDFGKSKYAVDAVEALLNKGEDFQKTAQAVAYTQEKAFGPKGDSIRFKYFDAIYEGIVLGKVRTFPRAFASMEQFKDFSQTLGAALRKYGKDVRVQGSSTYDLPLPVKDIDIAIFADETEFVTAMKEIWAKEYAKYYKLALKPPPDPTGIPTDKFLDFANDAIKTGKGGTGATGVRINGEMESAGLAWKSGKIVDSKFLSNAEKDLRDEWTQKLGLEKDRMDISLIMRGKPFDIGPFIDLPK